MPLRRVQKILTAMPPDTGETQMKVKTHTNIMFLTALYFWATVLLSVPVVAITDCHGLQSVLQTFIFILST